MAKTTEKKAAVRKSNSGQAMLETALLMPFLLAIALNIINFGYFFLIAVNLAAAPRSGALYSILGGSTPASSSASFPGLPSAGPSTTITSVSYLAYQDLTGAVYSPTTQGSIQVCSTTVGVTGTGKNTKSACASAFGSTPAYTFPANVVDPENDGSNPLFFASRVDIAYQFRPLVPGTPFNILLLASPICKTTSGVTCVFHRQAVMREMN